MAQIRDTDIIRTPEVTLDPRLFIPDGVIDIGVRSTEIDPDTPTPTADDTDAVDDGTTGSADTGSGTGDGGVVYDPPTNADIPVESGESDKLPTPQTMTIISQTIRIAPDGSSLVDVVIEVEDIPGVPNYDVRITKA